MLVRGCWCLHSDTPSPVHLLDRSPCVHVTLRELDDCVGAWLSWVPRPRVGEVSSRAHVFMLHARGYLRRHSLCGVSRGLAYCDIAWRHLFRATLGGSAFQQRSIPTLLEASRVIRIPPHFHLRACSVAVFPIFRASTTLRLVEALVIYDDMYRGPADWMVHSRHTGQIASS